MRRGKPRKTPGMHAIFHRLRQITFVLVRFKPFSSNRNSLPKRFINKCHKEVLRTFYDKDTHAHCAGGEAFMGVLHLL